MQNFRAIGGVMKGDLLQADLAGNGRHLFRLGLVQQLNWCIEQTQHLFASGHGCLHGGVNAAQLLNRLEEAGDISQEGDHNSQGDLAFGHGASAKIEDNRRGHNPQELNGR